jgi:hypothetical protein
LSAKQKLFCSHPHKNYDAQEFLMQKEKIKIKEQFNIIQNDLFSFFWNGDGTGLCIILN